MSAPIPLCDTTGMSRKRWLECRMHGPRGDIPYTVGGSDIAAIFGVSPWITPKELWLIKKGRMSPAKKMNETQLEMGNLLEPIAAHWYGRKTGDKVIDDKIMYRHADIPYALADFDRRYIRKSDGEKGILECKSCSYHKAHEWAKGAYPIYYELQLRYYLAVADVNIGAFSTVWGNNPEKDHAYPCIERDSVKEGIIFSKLEEWIWSLEKDKPPNMDDVDPGLALESLARIYPVSDPSLPTIEFSGKFAKPIRRILTLQDEVEAHNKEIKRIQEAIEAHSVRIIDAMGSHEHGVFESPDGRVLIDYVTKTQNRTDTARLKKEYPEIYQELVQTSTGRKLKIMREAV